MNPSLFIFSINKDVQCSMGCFYFHGLCFLQKVRVAKTQRRICLESEPTMVGAIPSAERGFRLIIMAPLKLP